MNYPKIIARMNGVLAIISGTLIAIIAVMTVTESLARSMFQHPSAWSMDLCCYFLLWAIFLGSPWAFQEKGHVAVDLVRDLIERLTGKKPRRIMAVFGYLVVIFVLGNLLRAAFNLASEAIKYDKLTIANLQIPTIYLHTGIIIGTIIMLATVVFIILDLLKGGEKYL